MAARYVKKTGKTARLAEPAARPRGAGMNLSAPHRGLAAEPTRECRKGRFDEAAPFVLRSWQRSEFDVRADDDGEVIFCVQVPDTVVTDVDIRGKELGQSIDVQSSRIEGLHHAKAPNIG
jgi:hypothetical protein